MRSSCIWGPKSNDQHPHKGKEREIQHSDTQGEGQVKTETKIGEKGTYKPRQTGIASRS